MQVLPDGTLGTSYPTKLLVSSYTFVFGWIRRSNHKKEGESHGYFIVCILFKGPSKHREVKEAIQKIKIFRKFQPIRRKKIVAKVCPCISINGQEELKLSEIV